MWFIWNWYSESRLVKQIDDLQRQLDHQESILKKLRFEQLELISQTSHIRQLIIDSVRKKLGPLGYIITSERNATGMADIISFNVSLPPKSAPDVVSRELSVKVGDNPAETRVYPPEALVATGFEGPQDIGVQISLVDIDDSGNRSEPSVLGFLLADLVPPPTPGTLGIVVVQERFDEDKVEVAEDKAEVAEDKAEVAEDKAEETTDGSTEQ